MKPTFLMIKYHISVLEWFISKSIQNFRKNKKLPIICKNDCNNKFFKTFHLQYDSFQIGNETNLFDDEISYFSTTKVYFKKYTKFQKEQKTANHL